MYQYNKTKGEYVWDLNTFNKLIFLYYHYMKIFFTIWIIILFLERSLSQKN